MNKTENGENRQPRPSGGKAPDHAAVCHRISKEAINELPLASWDGPTTVVQTVQELAAAGERLAGETVLGFDTETRPAFRKGQKFDPSLLQLASSREVFLFQLHQTGLTPALRTLLEDPAIIKAGVALTFDLASLQALQPFRPRGFVDLAAMAKARGIKHHGLRGLAAAVCGVRISKSARTSNWANPVLTSQQIRYAATDAWIGRELYHRLAQLPGTGLR